MARAGITGISAARYSAEPCRSLLRPAAETLAPAELDGTGLADQEGFGHHEPRSFEGLVTRLREHQDSPLAALTARSLAFC